MPNFAIDAAADQGVILTYFQAGGPVAAEVGVAAPEQPERGSKHRDAKPGCNRLERPIKPPRHSGHDVKDRDDEKASGRDGEQNPFEPALKGARDRRLSGAAHERMADDKPADDAG